MEFSGTLTKRGTRIRSWRRRYFTLINGTLTYYVTKGGRKKGEYIITPTTQLEDSSLRHFCFCLSDVNGRTLYLAADTIADKDSWIDALFGAINSIRAESRRRANPTRFDLNGGEVAEVDAKPAGKTENCPQLYVKVIQARGLYEKGTTDTYAKVFAGSSSARTKTRKKNLNPLWGMVFHFDHDRSMRYARIEVWDEDTSTRDTFLGVVLIPLVAVTMYGPDRRLQGWFKLGKRSSKSHVSGEIELEIVTDLLPDVNILRIFREVQTLPEFTCRVPNVFVDALPPNASPADRIAVNNKTAIWSQQLLNRFPSQYPPIECEMLEDISLRVVLKSHAEGEGIVFSEGILLLTSYRLLFVAHSRQCVANEDMNLLSCELTTDIAVGAITSIAFVPDQDPCESYGQLDSIRVKTSDARILSFLFRSCDDDEAAQDNITGPPRMLSDNPLSNKPSAKPRFFSTDGIRFNLFGQGSGNSATLTNAALRKQANKPRTLVLGKSKRGSQTSTSGGDGYYSTDDLSYVESSDCGEPPVSQRMFSRLNLRIINRGAEVRQFLAASRPLLDSLVNIVENKSPTATLSSAASFASTNESKPSEASNYGVPLQVPTSTMGAPQRDSMTLHQEASAVTMASYASWAKTELPVCVRDGLLKSLEDGWKVYDPMREFTRMGVPDNQWRITALNRSYTLSPTYPALLAVPSTLNDDFIMKAAQFRSKCRFPVLCWRHPTNKCSLTRSSQPMVGISKNRSPEDETLLAEVNTSAAPGLAARPSLMTSDAGSENDGDDFEYDIIDRSADISVSMTKHASLTRNSPALQFARTGGKPLVIADARPKLNAQANQAAGKGFELGKAYDHCRVIFMGIANIHAVRRSLDLLEEACSPSAADDATWYRSIELSGWLVHIRKILAAAVRIVHCISKEELSVLVHCSDGWDRTAQLTSLSMLMLDPYYRTFEGFQVLVDKEWFSFGHKFADRLGWTDEGWSDNERSPIFQQFLDCVHQCLLQHPDEFEFNEQLLVFLCSSLQSGMFGNFFANCECERLELANTSVSVWYAVKAMKRNFINPSFKPVATICVPLASAKKIVVWKNWFLRWHDRVWELSWHLKNENFYDGEEVAAAWLEDRSVMRCCDCDKPFTFYRRRHHCRACGLIFCEACAGEFRIVRARSETQMERVCNNCALQIDAVMKIENKREHKDSESVSHRSHKLSISSASTSVPRREGLLRKQRTLFLPASSFKEAYFVGEESDDEDTPSPTPRPESSRLPVNSRGRHGSIMQKQMSAPMIMARLHRSTSFPPRDAEGEAENRIMEFTASRREETRETMLL